MWAETRQFPILWMIFEGNSFGHSHMLSQYHETSDERGPTFPIGLLDNLHRQRLIFTAKFAVLNGSTASYIWRFRWWCWMEQENNLLPHAWHLLEDFLVRRFPDSTLNFLWNVANVEIHCYQECFANARFVAKFVDFVVQRNRIANPFLTEFLWTPGDREEPDNNSGCCATPLEKKKVCGQSSSNRIRNALGK